MNMNKTNIRRIDLNLFTVLQAIHAEGGVSRAAARLNLTQPAISHALARLRDIYNDPLFVRRGHRLEPTPLTRTIIEPVQRSLRLLEFTLSETAHFDPGQTRKRFTLGLRDILESTVLPPLLHGLEETAPGIDIASIRVDRRAVESGLAAGSIDLAIDILLPLSEEIQRQRVEAGRLAVVARRDHPTVGPDLDLATYLRQDHILVSSRRGGPGLEDVELNRLGLERRIRLRCQHYFAATRVVSHSDMILTMPERYARLLSRSFETQVLPLPIDAPTLDLYLYWHASMREDPANRWLRTQMLQIFAE